MMHSNVNTKTYGFTLLEILLVLLILGTVVSIVLTSYTGSLSAITETETQADVYETARIVLQRVQEDLESAYMPKGHSESTPDKDIARQVQFVGEDREIEGMPADTITFISRAHLTFDENDRDSGMAQIWYDIQKNKDGNSITLYRSDKPTIEESFSDTSDGLILCDNLLSVNFTYCDSDGNEYDSWDSSQGESRGKLPTIIAVMLEFNNKTDANTPYKFLTAVAPPLARKAYNGDSQE